MVEQDNNFSPDSSEVDYPNQLRPSLKGNWFFSALKNLIVFVMLVGVVGASFWLSFQLGKRFFLPVKRVAEKRIEIDIPEPPPSLKAMQKLQELMDSDGASGEPGYLPPSTVKPRTPVARNLVTTKKKSIVASKTSASGSYFKVQAGLFADKDSARQLADRLIASGIEAFIRPTASGWRVQAGAFRLKEQALSAQAKLQSRGFESTIIFE